MGEEGCKNMKDWNFDGSYWASYSRLKAHKEARFHYVTLVVGLSLRID